jgi:hypothetical protein
MWADSASDSRLGCGETPLAVSRRAGASGGRETTALGETLVIRVGRGRRWTWSAAAQAPAVMDVCVVMDASRTKRATLSVLVRMSPSTVALALLGKPNQGERLR